MFRKNLVFLFSSAALSLALLGLITAEDRELVVTSRTLPGQFRTPLMNFRLGHGHPPPDGSAPAKVLLIHGLAASKSAMIQMGSELARWGLDCHLMDLPGHGASPKTFSRTTSLQAVEEVVEQLRRGPSDPGEPSPLILVGHSFGASLALDAAQSQPQIAGVVAISPVAETITPTEPPQLLVLVGEFDFPFVRRGATAVFEKGTGIRLPGLDGAARFENRQRTRRLVVLPWTDHSRGIFSPGAFQEIRDWMMQTHLGGKLEPYQSWKSWFRIQLRAVFCLSLLLLWIPATALLAGIMRLKPTLVRQTLATREDPEPTLVLRSYALAAGTAVIILLAFNPWSRLGLMGGSYLSGSLFVAGMLGCLLTKPLWRPATISWRSLGYGAMTALMLVLVFAPFISQYFVYLKLTPARLWRIPWILVSVFPFYLFDEWVVRSLLAQQGRLRLSLFHLCTRLILAIIQLVGFFVLKNGQFLVVLVLPGLLLTSILCWCLAGWIFRKTGSFAASALFSALTTTWFFSAFFNQF
jgi:pimeloyl-ACP methyl ester carboxylesterase